MTSWGDELDVVCEEQMIACQFIGQVIDKYQEGKEPKHRALGYPTFYGTFDLLVVTQYDSESSVFEKLFYPTVNLGMDSHCFDLLDQQTKTHRAEGVREI